MSSCSADRISNLPCHVTNRILEHLPLRDVVRTSILSSGWRYKWTTIPRLSFDRHFEKLLKLNYDTESIIDRILVFHKGYVVKFSLNYGIKNFPAINRWLYFLTDHRIEDLVVSVPRSDTYPMMPVHLFVFDHLTHLKIKSCGVKLPPEFRGFRRLIKLVLVDVNIESGDLEMWLSKCPILEYLYVDDYPNYLCLNIDAPNLKFFYFYGWLQSICIKNSNLQEISIACGVDGLLDGALPEHFELPNSRGSESNLFSVLGHALSLQKLYLDCNTTAYLARGGFPRRLPDNLDHLTLLELTSFIPGYVIDVACALCLIRSSPNLQSLKLSACDDQYSSDDAVSYLKEEQLKSVSYLKEEQLKCDVPHSHLKYMKICSMSNLEHEMELVKLLLLLATALEKLEIKSKFSESTDKKDAYQMLREISNFRRSSSSAVVVFD